MSKNKKAVAGTVASSVATIEILKKIGYIFVIVSVLLIIISVIPAKKVTDNNFILAKHDKDGVLIMAEKGGYIQNPANTRKAFDAVIKNSSYTDIVELDVRTSKDGVLVIIEEATLNKAALKDGADPIYVRDLLVSELKKHNLGNNFVNEEGKKPYEGISSYESQGLSMLTLDEFFTRYQSSRTSVYYMIDFQENGEVGKEAVDKAVELLAKEDYKTFENRVIFTTTDKELKDYIDEKHDSAVICGNGDYTISLVNALKFGARQLVTPNYELVEFDMNEKGLLGIKFDVSRKSFINLIEEKNMAVIYKNVGTKDQIEELYKLEAHIIASGNPKFVDTTIKEIEKAEKE